MNKMEQWGTLLLSGMLLAGCSAQEAEEGVEKGSGGSQSEQVVESETSWQDGTYELSETAFSESGWKESLKIEVKDGDIVDVAWTSVNEAGLNKLEDDEYQATMSGMAGVGPQDFIPALEESLLETQAPADIEVVSGATGTSDKFKDYAQQLLEAAAEGNTEHIVVDNS